jgi:hypothetical protein
MKPIQTQSAAVTVTSAYFPYKEAYGPGGEAHCVTATVCLGSSLTLSHHHDFALISANTEILLILSTTLPTTEA